MEAVVEVEAVVGALQQLLSMVELLLPLQHLEALVEAVVKEFQSTSQLVDAVVELQPLQLELFQPHMQL